MNNTISRSEAIAALDEQIRLCDKALSSFSISMKDEYAVRGERASLVAFRETLENMLSAQPECEDAVPRTSVEYICRKNTVSTNPYEHKYHDKFIQFMDDPEISDFGRWKHSNGFNTALVAVKCDLDKVPPVTPKKPGWIPCSERLPKPKEYEDDVLKYYLIQNEFGDMMVCSWDGKYWVQMYQHKNIQDKVVAWRELPTPWEGGQDENN